MTTTTHDDDDDEYGAYTVAQFCERHNISLGFYYTLRNRNEGPREMRVGKKVLISREAAADWRRQTETGRAI